MCLFSKHPCETGKHQYHHFIYRKLKFKGQQEGQWVVIMLPTPSPDLGSHWPCPHGMHQMNVTPGLCPLPGPSCQQKAVASWMYYIFQSHYLSIQTLSVVWPNISKNPWGEQKKPNHQCLGLVNRKTVTLLAAESSGTPQKMLVLMEMRLGDWYAKLTRFSRINSQFLQKYFHWI